MTTDCSIIEKIIDVKEQLDKEEFAELIEYFDSLIEYAEVPNEYEVASDSVEIAKAKCFPKCLFEFIKDLYETEIKRGNSDAMNDLGALYYHGHGCEQDFEKGMKYYIMAAENGSRQAQENLGYCYYYGRDGEVNYEKAFHYFALGAFDGHLISLYKIGDMYKNGYYVKKNEKEAFAIYNRCLDTMTEEAAKFIAGPVFLRVGDMLYNGIGTEKNLESALICYQKAEVFLYNMVKDGDYMYKKSLENAIEGQNNVRKELYSN